MVKTTALIEGMKCGMCEAHMNDAVKKEFKVKKVVSSHEKNETVILSDSPIDEDKLKKVVADAGYELKEVKSEPYKKKGLFGR
ncbi:MAG: ATPase P [Clostridia bacterium]|nr:ATPase P [Clostridia bacterium]